MARMSIDDKFLRDARVVLLGRRFGWSRRETMGALLDVFALTYDQESDVITAEEIDVSAGEAGFAAALIEVDLGERTGGGVRIKGAAERIEYLSAKREAGRKGGRKSGESRRNKDEAKRSTASPKHEAVGNPPDPVPDVVPDPVLVPDQIPDPPPARAIPLALVQAEPSAVTQPDHEPTENAPPIQLPVAWSGPPDHRSLAARRALSADIRDAVNASRKRAADGIHGAKFRPLDAQDPGERLLMTYIVGADDLAQARETLLHVVAMAEVEAIAKQGLQWLTLSAIFSEANRTRFAGGTAAEFSRRPAKARGMAAVRAMPSEMDAARSVLAQLSADSGIPWRVEDGHAELVVERLRELVRSGVDPRRAEREIQAVVRDRGDEWHGNEAMRSNLCPSTIFGPTSKFLEYLTRARVNYAGSIADEQRKAGA